MGKCRNFAILCYLFVSLHAHAEIQYVIINIIDSVPTLIMRLPDHCREAAEAAFLRLASNSNSYLKLIKIWYADDADLDDIQPIEVLLDSTRKEDFSSFTLDLTDLYKSFRLDPTRENAIPLWNEYKKVKYPLFVLKGKLIKSGYNVQGKIPDLIIPYLLTLKDKPFSEERKLEIFFENMSALANY